MALIAGTRPGFLVFGKETGLEREESGVEPWVNGEEEIFRDCRDEASDAIDLGVDDDEDKVRFIMESKC